MSMKPRKDNVDWRECPRFTVDSPAHLIVGRAEMSVRLVEVSDSGVRLRSRTAHSVGEPYILQVPTGDGPQHFRILTKWDWFDNDHFLIGAEVLPSDSEDLARWKAVASALPRPGETPPPNTQVERRKTARIQKWQPLLYQCQRGWVKGVMQNVCEDCSGALIVVRAPEPPGDMVSFKLRIDERTCVFHALTAWWQFAEGYYNIGVEAIEADDPTAQILPRAEVTGIRRDGGSRGGR